ncbi:hypothetical protein BDZ97DRAFT_179374 [Flammula alnicola]|nr:hypothetical protein BDZ97DRAFT_179374 [Flammula alnicola]
MAKGRKSKNPLPDFIEISDDCLKVRCTICLAARKENGSGWINKGSVSNHLKSDNHANSLEAQRIKESAEKAGERSMQEESAMEDNIDFIILSSTIQPEATATAHAPPPQLSEEEQRMWDRYALGNEVFDAGVDHTLAAAEERKRLEQEAADFDLWHSADFLPEEDPNDGELLLDALEQEDILSELLRNASTYIPLNCFHTFQCISCFG